MEARTGSTAVGAGLALLVALLVALPAAASASVTFSPTITAVDSGLHDGRFWVQVWGPGPVPPADEVYSAFVAALVIDGEGRFFSGYDQVHDGVAETFVRCDVGSGLACPDDVPLEVVAADDGSLVFYFSFPPDVELSTLTYGAESGWLQTESSSYESTIFPASGPVPASTDERDPTGSDTVAPSPSTGASPTPAPAMTPGVVPSSTPAPSGSQEGDDATSAPPSGDGSSFPTLPLVGGGLALLLLGLALRPGTASGEPAREPVPSLGDYDEPASAELTTDDLAMYAANPDAVLSAADGTAVVPPPPTGPDEDWRLALYREQQVQASLKEAWLAAHTALGTGLAAYADALDRFKEHYQYMMSATTGLDGIMQAGADAQEVGRYTDIAFGLLQLGHGGYRAAVSRWWAKPPKVPFGAADDAVDWATAYGAVLDQADQAAMAKLAEEAGVDLATFVSRFDSVDEAGRALCGVVAKQRGWVGLGDELAGVLRRVFQWGGEVDPADAQKLSEWAASVPDFWDRLRLACDWVELPRAPGTGSTPWETLELLFSEEHIWILQRIVARERQAAQAADAVGTYRFGAGAVDEIVAGVDTVPPPGAFAGDTLPPPGAFAGETLPPPGAFAGETLPPPGAFGGDTVPPPGLFLGETLPPPTLRDSAVMQDALDTVIIAPGDPLASTVRYPGGLLGVADEVVTVPPPLRGTDDVPTLLDGVDTVRDTADTVLDTVDTVLDAPALRLYGPQAPPPAAGAPRLPRGGDLAPSGGAVPPPLDTSTLRGITTVPGDPPRLTFTGSVGNALNAGGLPGSLTAPPTTDGLVRGADRARANGIDPEMFLAATPKDRLTEAPDALLGCIARREGWHPLPVDAGIALENVVCDGRRAVGGDSDAAIDPANLDLVRTLAGSTDLASWMQTAYVECDQGWWFPYSADDAYVCEAALACDGDVDDLRTTLGEVRTAACESMVALQGSGTVPSPFTQLDPGTPVAGAPLVRTPADAERDAFLQSLVQQMQSATTAAHVGITAVPDAVWDPDEKLQFHFWGFSTDNQIVGSLWAGFSSPFETMAGAYWSGVALEEIGSILEAHGPQLGDLSAAFTDAVQAVDALADALAGATAPDSPLSTAEADLTAALAELEAVYAGADAAWQDAHRDQLDALRFHVAQKVADTKRACRALEALLARLRQICDWVEGIRPDGSTLDLVDPNVWGRLVAGLLGMSEAAGEAFLGSGTTQPGHGPPPPMGGGGEVPDDALPRSSYPTDGTSSLESEGTYDPETDTYSDEG